VPVLSSWTVGGKRGNVSSGRMAVQAAAARTQNAKVGLALTAAMLELQEMRGAYMHAGHRKRREAACLAAWPAITERGQKPIERERRGDRWAAGMEFRALCAEVAANPYSAGVEHPYEQRDDIRAVFTGLTRREQSVWRKQCSACFSEVRAWQRWPTWMEPERTGSKGRTLRKSRKTAPADDPAHVFGEVYAARQTFEAFETNAEQESAVKFFSTAERNAPSWAVPRGKDRPGPKPRRRGCREIEPMTAEQGQRKARALVKATNRRED